MKKIILLAATFLVILAVNYGIVKKEGILRNGTSILLRLAPVDPRSLMQGDYMVLRYVLANNLPKKQLANKGCIVVALDENKVAYFVRIHDDTTLYDGEYLLFYRNRNGLRLGAESFFFQEGDAKLYSTARYGELKVDRSGSSVLVGLRGDNFKPLRKALDDGAKVNEKIKSRRKASSQSSRKKPEGAVVPQVKPIPRSVYKMNRKKVIERESSPEEQYFSSSPEVIVVPRKPDSAQESTIGRSIESPRWSLPETGKTENRRGQAQDID